MNKRKFSYVLCLLASTVIIFSACKKNNDNYNNTQSGLMAFNLIPDKASIGFLISNNNLVNAPLSYSNYTGNYLSITSGQRDIQSFEASSDSVLASASYNFEPKKYYSLFATGITGMYKNIIVHDNFDSLSTTSGNAFVRYINAIPDSAGAVVTITANGTDIVNQPASFGAVSAFKEIAPGDISMKVNNSEEGIAANRTISIEKNKIYTVLLMGLPGETDTAKAVQIKYIQNGTVTP